ncbi:MAG: hypothetical protein OXU33_14550 [Gemmatimonadota bacterium]|nr:hypothetical protein [Gemmatimonadota bacterium]MDE3005729.1 hypothetical protein [Gemmatimonadota bacterium]MDE3015284.1 hypothetical protein [Gemmatimonadota bacterium]
MSERELLRKPLARSNGSRVKDGAMIVASILVAFGLEASWGVLQERQVERTLRAELAAEFVDARERIEGNAEFLKRAGEAIQDILVLMGPDPELVPADSVVFLLMESARTYTLDMPSSVVESVVTTDQLSIIQDPNLRRALLRWPVLLDDVLENHEWIVDQYRNQFVPTTAPWVSVRDIYAMDYSLGRVREIAPFRSPGRSRFGVDVDALLADRSLEQVLSFRLQFLYITVLETEALLSAADEILSMLGANP